MRIKFARYTQVYITCIGGIPVTKIGSTFIQKFTPKMFEQIFSLFKKEWKIVRLLAGFPNCVATSHPDDTNKQLSEKQAVLKEVIHQFTS